MPKFSKVVSTLKWYFLNFPLGCTIFLFLVGLFFYTKTTMKFPDEAVCLQPHFVMTGRVSRLIKYALFQHGAQTLLLSVLMIALVGTIAERQLGTLRFIYTFLIVIILTGLIITFISVIMAFTSQFSSLPYDCPGLGTSAPMFAMMVIVCRNSGMKKVVLLLCLVNKNLIPWIFLVVIQLLFPGTKLLSNFCGCIAGNLYLLWFSNSSCIPSSWLNTVDDFLSKTFAYVPIPKYVRSSTTKLLPVSMQDSTLLNHPSSPPHYQPDPDAPTSSSSKSVHGDMVPEYKISKIHQMGFAREECKVALVATGGDIEEATQLLAEARDSKDASSSLLASTSQ